VLHFGVDARDCKFYGKTHFGKFPKMVVCLLRMNEHLTPSARSPQILRRPETWQEILDASATWEPIDQEKFLMAMTLSIEYANTLGEGGLEPDTRELRIVGELSEAVALCMKYSEFCTHEYYFHMFFELLGLQPSFTRRAELYERFKEPDYHPVADTIADPKLRDTMKAITQTKGTIYYKPIGTVYNQVRKRLESLGVRRWL